MDHVAMSKALRERARALRSCGEGEPLTVGQLADDGELLLVLARIVEGKDVERAFGAPGDWGYSHPIGCALAARGEQS